MANGRTPEAGGEGANRTLPGPQSVPTAVLKTAGATRHPSLSGTRSSECHWLRVGSPHGPHLFHNRFRLREFAARKLGKNFLPVHGDLDGATAARHQRERREVAFEFHELVRQADGTRLVVSNPAVFDGDLQRHIARKLGGAW